MFFPQVPAHQAGGWAGHGRHGQVDPRHQRPAPRQARPHHPLQQDHARHRQSHAGHQSTYGPRHYTLTPGVARGPGGDAEGDLPALGRALSRPLHPRGPRLWPPGHSQIQVKF